jgi:murein DD-endopeptidase MepM/ murein hydrolase activator NlpD
VQVKAGQSVTVGQELGKCGNSGNTDLPHIHMHVQDTPTLNQGNGQNMIFKGINVELTGKMFENVDWPLITGLFVWNGKTKQK